MNCTEKRFFVHVQVSMHTWDPSPWKNRRERTTPAACGPQDGNRDYVSACVFSTKCVHWCPFRGMNEHVTPLLCSVVQGCKWKEPREQPLLMVGVARCAGPQREAAWLSQGQGMEGGMAAQHP